MDIAERLPLVGATIKEQRKLISELKELVEAKTEYQIELEEDIKDWMAIAAQSESKDVDWSDYKQNHKDCWEAYVENPLAKGYIDRLTDFVVKGGFEVISDDEKTQTAIDAFLEASEWDEFQVQACRELTIYGELFDRAFNGGEPEFVFVDPATIEKIKTDPENVKSVESYGHRYDVVTYDDEGNETSRDSKWKWINAEEIIHIKENTVSTAKRGISDLLPVLKWLTRHKEVATNLVRRSNIQMSVVAEKIIKGHGISTTTVGGYKKDGDDATNFLTNKRKERTVTPGTWYVHTPNVEYKFTAIPNDVRGMVELLKMLNKIICAGLGLSEHWLGDTSESNLATATSLELPILAKFERRQNKLKNFFKKHIAKALELKGIEGAEFEIIPPELSPQDAVKFAQAIRFLCEGLAIAVTRGWLSRESAALTIGDYLDHFDSFDTEKERMANEELARQEEPPIDQQIITRGLAPFVSQNPNQALQNQDMSKQLVAAIREAEFKFSKAAMDGLIVDYAKALKEQWDTAREKVLKVAKEGYGQAGS